jgi:phosphatidylglycerol:prolipoprotein diacylglycerol transferase
MYDAGAELIILGLLLFTERKGRRFAGRTFWAYLLLYGISRFVIEFYRGDINRGTIGGALSTSQFVSALLVPLSLAMLVYLRRGARAAKA